MRLGGPIFGEHKTPEEWVALVKKAGYSAAYCPVDAFVDEETIRAYAEAARRADIVIAEVGAWSNPLIPDEEERKKALELCKRQLDLADRIGACCCVNIAGSRGRKWDGPSPLDLTEETFQMIVYTVREIIDDVKPTRTFYTLETMPWMFPDSPDNYLRLIKAIDRERFAVHFDIVNLISSPQRYFHNSAFIKECVEKLGSYIKSCHVKDVILRENFLVHLDEVRPGLGGLDYSTLLKELDRLSPDLPIMLEHLPSEEEYRLARDYILSVAQKNGIQFK